MPNDVFHGGDCEIRIGRRANAASAPTAWQAIDFMTLTVNPTQERRDRPKLGDPAKRLNPLDPLHPRKGFFRLTAELVIDADSRALPIWLRYALGAPASAPEGEDHFAHVFASGQKTEQYFDIALKVGAADVRLFQGLTLSQISLQAGGENTQDFNINISLVGLSRDRVAAFPAGAVAPAPAEAPMLRALFKVDDVAATNMLTAGFSWDRQIQEGIYLSATPTISSLAPNGAAHSGTASFRAIGAVFDAMEEDDDPFAAAIDLLGVAAGHHILIDHPQALLAPSPMPIAGPGMVERSLNWAPYQTASSPALRITVVNDIADYAAA